MIEPSLKPAEAAVTPVKKEEGWWETVKVIIEALLIALVVRTVLFEHERTLSAYAERHKMKWSLISLKP